MYTTRAIPFAKNEFHETEFVRLAGMENPHWLFTGGSQTGKTTASFSVAGLAAAVSCIVLVFDPKWRWKKVFGGLPHVLIYDDPEEWHHVSIAVYHEMVRRYKLDNARLADLSDEATFPRILVIADEFGSLLIEADIWWRTQINEESGKPNTGTAPLNNTWQFLLWRGAEAGIVMGAIAQQANAKIFPYGTGSRQLYGQRLALGVDLEPHSWLMLAGKGRSKPHVPDNKKGAGVYLQGNRMVRVQTGKGDADQLARLARRGIPLLQRNGHIDASGQLRLHSMNGVVLPRPGATQWDVADSGTSTGGEIGGQGALELPPGGKASQEALANSNERVVGLEAAATYLTEWSGRKYTTDGFRKARERRPIEGEKKAGSSPTWTKFCLRKWHQNRPIAGQRS